MRLSSCDYLYRHRCWSCVLLLFVLLPSMVFSSARCAFTTTSARTTAGWRILGSTSSSCRTSTRSTFSSLARNPPILLFPRRPVVVSTTVPVLPPHWLAGLSNNQRFGTTAALFSTKSSNEDTEAAAAGTFPHEKNNRKTTRLRNDLDQYRIQQSAPLKKPKYTIFTNAIMDEIQDCLPTTSDELLKVKGIGPKKLELYGSDILSIVAQYTDVNGNNARSSSSEDDELTSTQTSSSSSSSSFSLFDASGRNLATDDTSRSSSPWGTLASPNQKPILNTAAANGSSSISLKRGSKTRLTDDLKQYRLQQSAPLGKPPYSVITNAVIADICHQLPTTSEELLDVKGIGPKKLELYGNDILSIVAQYADANGNARSSSSSSTSTESTKSRIARPAFIEYDSLTDEQRRAADLLLSESRPNVFCSGQAGTGKSYLLKFVVQELQRGRLRIDTTIVPKDMDANDIEAVTVMTPRIAGLKVGVCAPTGVAAIHVGGSTLHSFFGIGLGTGSLSKLIKKVKSNADVQKRIDETNVLIIDECSMLSWDLLETIDVVVRQVRQEGKYVEVPFGGMQVICFGDFFQLPPISRGPEKPFCFESPVWQELELTDNMVELQEVQRQEHSDFVDLLNKVRTGQVDQSEIQTLNSRCVLSESHPLPSDGIVPTRLYSLNKDVDAENESRLAQLDGEEVVCVAKNKWRENMPTGTLASVKKKMADSLSKELPDKIKLKVGAQVMLTRNKDLDRNLVNGSRGVVIRFERGKDGQDSTIPVVRFDCGIVTSITPVEAVRYNPEGGGAAGCLVRLQVPLKLAWAITVHKSQGATLTRALLDISSAFEFGQCYVALSRVKSMEGLWLVKPARLHNIKVSPQVLDFYNSRRPSTDA